MTMLCVEWQKKNSLNGSVFLIILVFPKITTLHKSEKIYFLLHFAKHDISKKLSN